MANRNAKLALAAALLGVPAAAAVWLVHRAPAPASEGVAPELAMPGPAKIGAPAEESSLEMVRRGEEPDQGKEPPSPPPAPDQLAPMRAPPAVPPAPPRPAGTTKRPRLLPMKGWHHLLRRDDEDEPAQMIIQPAPSQQAPGESPKTPPAAPARAAPQTPAPLAETPKKPAPAKRGYKPPPPAPFAVQTGPTTQVSAASPATQQDATDPLPPPTAAAPQLVDNHYIGPGASDTPPPPNPVSPAATASACLRPGSWKNSWTGVCYPTRDECAYAQPKGACFQPNPRKALPQ